MVRRTPLRKIRPAIVLAAVLAGMAGAWAAGYAFRSPLGRSESLLDLIESDPAVLAHCGDARGAWDEFRRLPRYREFAETPDGRAFLRSSPFAALAKTIERRSRVLGRPLLDVWDVCGGGTVVAVWPARGARGVFLGAARLGPRASLLLGLYAGTRATERLATPAGGWWMRIQGGVAWTKVGNVLAVSNDAGVLGRFVAAARRGRRKTARMARLFSGGRPQVAVRVPSFGPLDRSDVAAKVPWACLLSVRFGDGVRADSSASAGRGHAAFRDVVADLLPPETCAGAVWRLDPRKVWRLVQSVLPESERQDLLRYVEEDLCAFLDVEDFEAEVVSRFTGDFAAVMSSRPDAWLSLASGGPAPTVSFVLRFRTDEVFERRLPFALKGLAAGLARADRRVVTRVGREAVEGHPAVHLWVLRVRRGAGGEPGAGYFIVPDPAAPGHSLLVVSTSAEWLRRAVAAREGAAGRLGTEAWFRTLVGPVRGAETVFAFARGDRLARALAPAGAGTGVLGGWLRLMGAVGLAGRIDGNGVIRADVRVSGQRLGF